MAMREPGRNGWQVKEVTSGCDAVWRRKRSVEMTVDLPCPVNLKVGIVFSKFGLA